MAVGCSSIRGRSQMLFKLLFILCLSPIHSLDYDKSSSLIEEKCAYGDYENVNVKFGGKYFLSQSNCGADVPLKDVNEKQPPSVTFTDAVKGKKYLVAMVDPDAPYADNPGCQSWLHWIVVNIDGEDLAKGVNTYPPVDTITDYNPPSPPKPKPGKTNIHRYFVYVFEQESELQPNELGKLKEDFQERCRFDIDDFRDKLNLKTVAMNMLKTHS
ncbi:unnamed protein product [Porites lobata]|uniref:Phosphatidylethanolamine-binding protein n=1 Tax=Porites lobata TaxID=104759 RepID=A0ABN8MQS5_9CNID|nr:unnamed protein product [Porites lobata]